jgi:hypothetical protein
MSTSAMFVLELSSSFYVMCWGVIDFLGIYENKIQCLDLYVLRATSCFLF